MEILAVIPARGGSKAIPRKNLQLVGGKPLLLYTIENALQTPLITRVVISTDDAEIAAVSQQAGAEVVWRPQDISGDTATSESALLYTLEHLRETEGYIPDLFVFLQCTSPLVHPADIEGTIRTLLNENADSALSATNFHYFLWKHSPEREAVPINHQKHFRPRRQDRDPEYVETGAVYVMRTQGFLDARHRFFGKTVMYIMPQDHSMEIDELVDLHVADILIRKRENKRKSSALPAEPKAVALAFNGVLSDHRQLITEQGTRVFSYDSRDNYGIRRLLAAGIRVLVLSASNETAIAARCDALGIECRLGVEDKGSALKQWMDESSIDAESLVYIGNDVGDIGAMRIAGCAVAVADAVPDALNSARISLENAGGNGAVRELADLIFLRSE